MAEIVQISTIERRLYQPDIIPVTFLQLQSSMQTLRQRYYFLQLAPQSVEGGTLQLVGSNGEFVVGETRHAVPQLLIVGNLIEVQTTGESEIADQFFTNLAEFLNSIDPQKNFSNDKEQARTYQTIAMARLSISPEQMLSDRLRKYLHDKVVPELGGPEAEPELRLARLGWQVHYTVKSSTKDYTSKFLIIEPRTGSSPSDRLFFTHSPTTSAAHKKLLTDLEEAFAEEKQTRK